MALSPSLSGLSWTNYEPEELRTIRTESCDVDRECNRHHEESPPRAASSSARPLAHRVGTIVKFPWYPYVDDTLHGVVLWILVAAKVVN